MDRPDISIAIACVNGLPYIQDCLDSFARQDAGVSYEVIVADRCNAGCREVVRRHPAGRLIEVDRPGATIPELRALAIRQARGKLVGVTEDHCLAAPGWFDAIWQAHASGQSIVGGPVENASTARLLDWAVFFCEYSAFSPPLKRGRGAVPGNNITYDRSLLPLIDDLLDAGVWEEEFNVRLARHGHATFVEPGAVMLHRKSFGLLEFIGQRYHYARSFAGLRLRRSPLWHRPAYSVAAAVLPPLLLGRIVRNVWRRGRQRRRLVLALPLLAVFAIASSVGEAIGYLFGPGDSLARVE